MSETPRTDAAELSAVDAYRIGGTFVAAEVAKQLERELQSRPAHGEGVVVPREPTEGVLMSIALRLDHALGCPGFYDQPMLGGKPGDHARKLELALSDARRAYEEVVGAGFYSPEREDHYKALAAAPAPSQSEREAALERDAERWRKQRQLGVPCQDENGFWLVRVAQAADFAIDSAIEALKAHPPTAEREERRDAARFRYLQSLPVVEAQAFFWNWPSRKQRAKEIDSAIAAGDGGKG